MSMKERPRERKEVNDDAEVDQNSINDWLDNVDLEEVEENKTDSSVVTEEKTVKPKVIDKEVVIDPTVKETSIEVDPMEIFVVKLPSWTKKPWMYVKPTNEAQLLSWTDSWKGVVLEYSRTLKIHVVNLSTLQSTHPFRNDGNAKTLTYDQLQHIINVMVKDGLAKWMDENQISARIYYLTDKEWAKKIIDYLVETGYAAEVMTFYELQDLKQDWSSLPHTELRNVFDILVAEGRAKWVGETKDTLTFIL